MKRFASIVMTVLVLLAVALSPMAAQWLSGQAIRSVAQAPVMLYLPQMYHQAPTAPGPTPTATPMVTPTVTPTPGPTPAAGTVGLSLVAEGLVAPMKVVPANDGSGRLFIVDQIGVIYVMMPDGTVLDTPFLDLRSELVPLMPDYDERGLLGLALHPDFPTNGLFYVYYSGPLDPGSEPGWSHTNYVTEFMVSANNPNVADPTSGSVVRAIDWPQFNHNGGDIGYGPDGYLYIPVGDGGGANDVGPGHPPLGNGQDYTTILGDILRINPDVSQPDGTPYGIPPDNPFLPMVLTATEEIYAMGFRNPHKMSWDAETGDLYVSDAGQELWEEVSVVTLGGNYGWRIKEGTHCFNYENPIVSLPTCPQVGARGEPLIDPVIEYPNIKNPAGGIGHVVVGGFVYRGSMLPGHAGRYIFGDWSANMDVPMGSLWSAIPQTDPGLWATQSLTVTGYPTRAIDLFVRGFGEDQANELYLAASREAGPTGTTGAIYKITSTDNATPALSVVDQWVLSDTVTVAEAVSAGPGWMVIHADNNGAPGPVIGWAPVSTGRSFYVTVPITASMATPIVHAMLHVDAGQVGVYEFPGADVPVQLNGQIVMQPFEIQSSGQTGSSIMVQSQLLTDDSVTVARVVSPVTGWLAIYNTDGFASEAVIGWAAVPAGTTVSLTVPITLTMLEQPTLYAALIVDQGVQGAFEVPGADEQFVMAYGQPVTRAFTLEGRSGSLTVEMITNAFVPSVLGITVGSSVMWRNQDLTPHTTTENDSLWDSDSLAHGATFTRVFTTTGVYPYYCRFHGTPDAGMRGTVVSLPGSALSRRFSK